MTTANVHTRLETSKQIYVTFITLLYCRPSQYDDPLPFITYIQCLYTSAILFFKNQNRIQLVKCHQLRVFIGTALFYCYIW